MPRGLEQGSVYTPRFAQSGRPVASPDEDSFSMAVAALERAEDLAPAAPPSRVHLVGEFSSVVDWGLAAVLGGPVEVMKHAGNSDALRGAVVSAEAEHSGESVWVVVVEVSKTTEAGAVALRFGPRPIPVQPDWNAIIHPGSAFEVARAALPVGNPDSVNVPPAAAPPPAWTAEGADAYSAIALDQVSEGAYVPRARYLENLPSRWRLEADRCGECRHLTFPRRGACRSCGRVDRLTVEALPRNGAKIVASTVIGKGGQPTEFDPQVEALGPYGVVLAEFAPGVRLTLQVTDSVPGSMGIGARIGTELRRLYPMEGEWRYGRKAVPLRPAGSPA
jgi:uncharacterized OB-fold protein